MAGIELRNGRYNIILRFGGKRFIRSLKTSDHDDALGRKLRVEENIRLIESGRLQVPAGADLVTFLLSDGKLTKKPIAKASVTLSKLFDDFFDELPEGSLEETSIGTMKTHRGHFERILGKRFIVQDLAHDDLQKYVTTRSKKKTRKGTVTATTIKKELVTFGTVWKWGVSAGHLKGVFPRNGLRMPKVKESPVFQTREEIQRQIASGASEELWDALYLSMAEIEKLLEHVHNTAGLPFIHPMFATAAYTGARRSELLRSQLSDIDLERNVLTIREKKRVRGTHSTRRVPISAPLEKVLRTWIDHHPGSNFTFCHHEPILHSRKAKAVTDGLTKDQAAHYFRQPIEKSEWDVIKGWHCLRHSFISGCASKDIDQRMIDEWVGHTTEAIRRRYRHFFPSSQQNAMESLFA
ncbi:tyrosine-type recombinase/integrase [Novipirellula herctigrandis]|uniref:tyrosine-type recombinase/integrase n=1 Tax=Novipirellula herctigrandis TaxID=2527986 RepID=UPI003AF3CF21